MFVGDLAIALNLLSVAVLAFAISVACISNALRLTLPRFEHLTFRLRKVILWALVTVPWWVAISCAAFFWPRQQELFSTAWLNEFAHWHHVDIFSFSSWHAFTLLSAFGYLIWSMISTIYVRKKQSSTMASLIGLSEIQPQVTITQQRYYSLAQAIPAAFTTGLVSPKIYLTTGLQEKVTEQQLDIIVRHEMAHVVARDPLFKVIFAAFAGFYPKAAKRNLIGHFTLLTEQLADHAVTTEHDNLDVAQALINVARMQRSVTLGCDGLQTSYFGNDQTSVRVQRLIQPRLTSSRLAIGLTLLFLAIVPLLTASTVDSLHHIIETFFTH
ncbi:M56 family metallopeptidase (plasmid) [Shewanella sp. LC6]|uniref:M56 family metallopeptidase n=1 Tax=Shewanella xiamenensis TaxID=332186 RepID=A0AAE4TQJ4_9GAMM|nr:MULTISPECIES: M56 family metallopeptidase [Shewanella]MCB2384735.1 M56 family metallopeptidase [Shewanella sp. SR1]MDN5501534.1 M56 family metallopeptidase [Shewanella sp.]MDN5529447.1 M56 family metallopeptidase [Shewanella sp.]MDV5393038.1 M56 family metallopeptidase [Shewanella xiamenensis]QQK62371.1 M56 family metallopeptidase [Shewanella sp. LC6]